MHDDITFGRFIWNSAKEQLNINRHGIDFYQAAVAFEDPRHLLILDEEHSFFEPRFYCLGKIEDRIVTIRYTYRNDKIQIIGAGFWRKGRKLYEKANSI